MDPILLALLALVVALIGNGRPSPVQRDLAHAAAALLAVVALFLALD